MRTQTALTVALVLLTAAVSAQEVAAPVTGRASRPVAGAAESAAGHDIQGFAGPGWDIRFAGGDPGMDSLGPVMFRVGRSLFLGPTIAYSESSAEGPSRFLGGVRAEWYPPLLARGWYATSASLTLAGGASGLSGAASPAAAVPIGSATVDVNANLTLFPELTLAVGPSLTLDVSAEGASLAPGVTFALKEGTAASERALVDRAGDRFRVGGYWQGLFAFLDGRPYFVDGGGTRVILPSGLAFGITGGVLRMRFAGDPGYLAVMHTGITAEWNIEPLQWLTIAPRLTTGLAMYGWTLADGPNAGTLQGGPTFMLRPEIMAFVRVLPFLRVGGGVGYQAAIGNPTSDLDTRRLSSVTLTIQARVGI